MDYESGCWSTLAGAQARKGNGSQASSSSEQFIKDGGRAFEAPIRQSLCVSGLCWMPWRARLRIRLQSSSAVDRFASALAAAESMGSLPYSRPQRLIDLCVAIIELGCTFQCLLSPEAPLGERSLIRRLSGLSWHILRSCRPVQSNSRQVGGDPDQAHAVLCQSKARRPLIHCDRAQQRLNVKTGR